jgi:tRNA (cmo5U34)-methyltransferase
VSNTIIDDIYAEPRATVERFCFDQDVVRVFPDMLKRSIPGYASIIDMIGILAAGHARPDTLLYDLGCSLGAASFAMARAVRHSGCRVRAVDSSAAMIRQAKLLLGQQRFLMPDTPIDFVQASLQSLQWDSPASMMVLNFTLQFVPLSERDGLLANIAHSLVPKGVLVLSEKICFSDPAEEAEQQALYYDFKRNNGYSELEISQKREALENVLVPETIETHRHRLLRAGFRDVYLWFRCFNFCSMIAVR